MNDKHTNEPTNSITVPDLSEGYSDVVETNESESQAKKLPLHGFSRLLMFLVIFTLGLGSGYLIWETELLQNNKTQITISDMISQINPPDGYQLSVTYGDTGPRMITAGAIDYDKFLQVYDRAGSPLTDAQKEILTSGSDKHIVFNNENAYFLLNYFWALGLVNNNPILMEGPMMQNGSEEVGRFASTGGWTIGTKPATDIYSSALLLTLSSEQQTRLENVTQNIYRPCCNNPTHFPDCNHGMAMLGMLTLLASEDASETELYEAAKYANAYWYPQQYLELALYFDAVDGQEFAKVDSQKVVSGDFSSGSGFGQVHQYLVTNGLLEQAPGSGNSCGV
jgi:hypothetical protein